MKAPGLVLSALAVASLTLVAVSALEKRAGARALHNGWRLTPIGTHEPTGDMIIGTAVSPDGATIAFLSAGFGAPKLSLVDASTGAIRQRRNMPKAFHGVAWTPKGDTIYVPASNAGEINVFTREGDAFAARATLKLKLREGEKVYLAGAVVLPDGKTLVVADLAGDRLLAIDLATGDVAKAVPADTNARPYALRLSADGRSLFVANLGGASVDVYDVPALTRRTSFATGNHPNALVEHADGRLFVSCGNDDEIDVIDPSGARGRETIRTRPTPNAPAGSIPSALALSPDGRALYVALSGNNAVAVVDVSQPGASRLKGLIPTGWYPTAVAALSTGKLVVGVGKGMGTTANPVKQLPIDSVAPGGFQYIGSMLAGYLTVLDVPNEGRLRDLTRQVLANSPYRDAVIDRPAQAPRPGSNPIPSRLGDASPIEHVLYIIKENRTYDQVFGDFRDAKGRKMGNGDERLTLFGEDVTPNHHELARRYVLLDNIYCDGEVSQDGHPWTIGAYVTDFTARAWPQGYSGKGAPPNAETVTDPPAGMIWENVARKGLAVRGYYGRAREYLSERYREAQRTKRDPGNENRPRDTDLADAFIEDLRESERTGKLPSFMIMGLGEDHTRGTRVGAYTPKACVASNDLALGRIVEACSKSKFWPKMAIFVIQDDAQNGPDHVDAHRTVALVVSPYTRRAALDSTHYTTASMLRSMELILGLRPMSQVDAGATPMYRAFGSRADATPYAALPARIDLNAKNSRTAYGAAASAKLSLEEVDELTVQDEDTLNRILWHSIKGAKTPYPGVVRAGFAR